MSTKPFKNILALGVLSSLMILGTGCSMFSSKDDAKPDEEKKENKKPEIKNLNAPEAQSEDEQLKNVAENYMDSIMMGMKNKDYKMFSEHLTDELKTDITKDKFQLMVDSFDKEKGTYESRKYLGTLQKNYFRVYLWKAKYKKAATKAAKDDLENDTLVRLILGKVDDKYFIFGFSFQ